MKFVFPLLAASMLAMSVTSCQNNGRLYDHPQAQQAHAVLEFARVMPAQQNPPYVEVIEINGKPPSAPAAGFMPRKTSLRLQPGPTHLFVQGHTGLGVAATAHLDFVARAGAVYKLDQAIGMTEMAFMVTESGRRVATASGAKAVVRQVPTHQTPFFVPIIVP